MRTRRRINPSHIDRIIDLQEGVYTVVRKNKSNEALRLIKEWNNTTDWDKDMERCINLHGKIMSILREGYERYNHVIYYCHANEVKKFNGIVDTMNEFMKANPFIMLKYCELTHLNTKDVHIIGDMNE